MFYKSYLYKKAYLSQFSLKASIHLFSKVMQVPKAAEPEGKLPSPNNFCQAQQCFTWVSAVTLFSLGNRGGSSPTWKSKYTVLCVKVENSLLKQNLYVPFLDAVNVKLSYCFFISLYSTMPSGSSNRQSTS